MLMSDWSSDVCSSDLARNVIAAQEGVVGRHPARKAHPPQWIELEPAVAVHIAAKVTLACAGQRQFRTGHARAIGAAAAYLARRSEGSRVGEECDSTCRSRGQPTTEHKKQNQIMSTTMIAIYGPTETLT